MRTFFIWLLPCLAPYLSFFFSLIPLEPQDFLASSQPGKARSYFRAMAFDVSSAYKAFPAEIHVLPHNNSKFLLYVKK